MRDGSGRKKLACDYCRKMHTCCNGGPICLSCQMKNQKCVFTPRRKPGPKNREHYNGTAIELIPTLPSEPQPKRSRTKNVAKTESPSEIGRELQWNEQYSPSTSTSSTHSYPNNTFSHEASNSEVVLAGDLYYASDFISPSSPSTGYNTYLTISDPFTFAPFSPSSSLGFSESVPFQPTPKSFLYPTSSSASRHTITITPYSPSPEYIPTPPHGNFSTTSPTPVPPPTSKREAEASPSSSSSSPTSSSSSSSSAIPEVPLPFCGLVSYSSFFSIPTQPYRKYLTSVSSEWHEDPLSVFNWIEIPPLRHLMPLVTLTPEGKLKQSVLLCYLSLGAMAYRKFNEAKVFWEMAAKNLNDFLNETSKEERYRSLVDLVGQTLAIYFISGHLSGQSELADGIGIKVAKYYRTLCVPKLPSETGDMEKWTLSHIHTFIKGFGSLEERLNRSDALFSASKEAKFRVWITFTAIWDIVMEAAILPARLRQYLPYNRALGMLSRAEDTLAYIGSMKVDSPMYRTYSGAFLGYKAVIGRLTGCHSSAGAQAATALQKLLPYTKVKEGELIVCGVLCILPFLAKVLWLSGNMEMWNACIEALRNCEAVLPGIAGFNALFRTTTDSDDEPWISIETVRTNRKNTPLAAMFVQRASESLAYYNVNLTHATTSTSGFESGSHSRMENTTTAPTASTTTSSTSFYPSMSFSPLSSCMDSFEVGF